MTQDQTAAYEQEPLRLLIRDPGSSARLKEFAQKLLESADPVDATNEIEALYVAVHQWCHRVFKTNSPSYKALCGPSEEN